MKRLSSSSLPEPINLRERFAKLTAKRQEILRPVLEHPRGFVLLSVRAMAKRLGTDPATIVRIVRVLGFAAFREFQKHLHDLSIAFATSADTMQAGHCDRGRHSFVADSIDRDLKNLHGLKNTLEANSIWSLAKRFYSARRVVLLAGDLAACLAEYLQYQTSLLGLPVFIATSAGRINHLTRSLTADDLVIAISFRRGLRQTVDGVRNAREHGAHCVAITDTYLSPLARIAHKTFLAGIESTSFGASYAAPVALINSLLAACGQVHKSETMKIVREISEEQRHGSRWFQE